jgi:hypothetical protein
MEPEKYYYKIESMSGFVPYFVEYLETDGPIGLGYSVNGEYVAVTRLES